VHRKLSAMGWTNKSLEEVVWIFQHHQV